MTIAQAIPFDGAVSTHACRFTGRNGFSRLRPHLPSSLAAAASKRQNEYLAGRYCAARALRKAGCAAGAWAPPGEDRLPRWPAGWVGSISHSPRGAVAAVGPRKVFRSIGVDMEAMIAPGDGEPLAQHVASPEEWSILRPLDAALRLTLMFSAKEALYKALFPLVRTFQDFDAAQACALEDDRITFRLARSWGADWPAGLNIGVQFRFQNDHVYTLSCV